jgi:hypothetical protein
VTDTDFDLDDEPVLTAEGEVAAAICGHQVVVQRGDALTAIFSTNSTASFRKSWPRFSKRRTPRLPICALSPTVSSPTPLRCAYIMPDWKKTRLSSSSPHTSLRSSKPSAPPTTPRSKSTIRSLARSRSRSSGTVHLVSSLGFFSAESLVRTPVGGGVEVCFANPGTSEMHFVAALDRVDGVRSILGLFEGVVTGVLQVSCMLIRLLSIDTTY